MSANWADASRPDVGVLVPAGGRGERAGPGIPKQFRPIAGVPMLLRTLRPFAQHPDVGAIVVALPAPDAAAPPPWLADVAGERLTLVAGGAERVDSVEAALRALPEACTVVLVHDAARPFVSAEEIDTVIAAARRGTGAVPAVPVADTLKQAGTDNVVAATVSRAGLWRALTPQGFPRALLEDAFARRVPGASVTDDAALVEAAGGTVRLVPGRTTNLKITTPEDFQLAETLATA